MGLRVHWRRQGLGQENWDSLKGPFPKDIPEQVSERMAVPTDGSILAIEGPCLCTAQNGEAHKPASATNPETLSDSFNFSLPPFYHP